MAQPYQVHSAASPSSMQTFTVAERLAGEMPLDFREQNINEVGYRANAEFVKL